MCKYNDCCGTMNNIHKGVKIMSDNIIYTILQLLKIKYEQIPTISTLHFIMA